MHAQGEDFITILPYQQPSKYINKSTTHEKYIMHGMCGKRANILKLEIKLGHNHNKNPIN